MVTVPLTGPYRFTSNSTIDTWGYLYNGTFLPTSTSFNLITSDDNSGTNNQFKLTQVLQANETYVLVATTHDPFVTGAYTVIVFGLVEVNIVRMNTTSRGLGGAISAAGAIRTGIRAGK